MILIPFSHAIITHVAVAELRKGGFVFSFLSFLELIEECQSGDKVKLYKPVSAWLNFITDFGEAWFLWELAKQVGDSSKPGYGSTSNAIIQVFLVQNLWHKKNTTKNKQKLGSSTPNQTTTF